MENSLAKTTRQVLASKPYLNYALKKGVVNYSALAKQLQPEVELALGRRREY